MKVVELPVGNLLDIPAMMRRVADAIERGEYKADHAALVLTDSDGLRIFQWGPSITKWHMAGLFFECANESLKSGENV